MDVAAATVLKRYIMQTLTTSEKGRSNFADTSYKNKSQPFFAPLKLQPKLTIGAVDDPHEQEADSVAEQVMQMHVPQNNASGYAGTNSSFFAPAPVTTQVVSRKCARCEEEEKIQKKSQVNGNVTPHDQSGINDVLKSSGQPLPAQARSFFEPRFGRDFSSVKIHSNSLAAKSADSINALAYTSGNNIAFNHNQFAPDTETGKKLLAHELTHVVQQGHASGIQNANTNTSSSFVQRTPTPGTTESQGTVPATTTAGATVTPATEADVRQMVNDATGMLVSTVEFYQLARVDDTIVERVLAGWIRMATIYPDLIATRLNNDDALLQAYKSAFNNAVRTLFTRRAAQPGATTSVINLYLSNLHRLPGWSWPDVASFNLTNDTQRRAFITTYTTSLNISSLFQGFTAITSAQLESVLSYLFTLTTDTQNMLAANLGNDATLLAALQPAYRTAVNSLLSRAATAMPGQTVTGLFMRYRYQNSGKIHGWADQQISGMTVAVPLGQSADPLTGDINFSFNNYSITMRGDGSQTYPGATTHTEFAQVNIPYQFDTSTNRITSFTPPAAPSVTIWTDYGPGVNSRSSSGYGRGTTVDDARLGNTSLGYHERTHSRDFLRFMANTPPPAFAGTVGMTVTQFRAAVRAYTRALARISRESELATDCVGTPNIVQYHRTHGTRTTVTCP